MPHRTHRDKRAAIFLFCSLIIGLCLVPVFLAQAEPNDPAAQQIPASREPVASSINAEVVGDVQLADRPAGASSRRPGLSADAQAVSPAAPTPTFEDQVAELVNEARGDAGLPPLKRVAPLDTSSEGHSTRMAGYNFFMHCDPDTGKLPWVRMQDAGYQWSAAGEVIAAGYSSPDTVVAAWMASEGHREIILSSAYREMGVGYFYQANDTSNVRQDTTGDCVPESANSGPFKHYWTLDAGQRSLVWPLVIEAEAFASASIRVGLYLFRPTNPSQMRFSNDGAAWSAWQPFSQTASWLLSPGNGSKTVYAEVFNGTSTYTIDDTIYVDAPLPTAPEIDIAGAAPVTLAWTHDAANLWYNVYRSVSGPYFAPGGGDSTLVGPAVEPASDGSTAVFTDTAALPGQSYFYLVVALGGDGQTYASSNRTGRFVYGVVPGGG